MVRAGAAVLFRFARFSARLLRMTCRVPGGRTVAGAGYPAGCFDVAGPCLRGGGPSAFTHGLSYEMAASDSAFRFRIPIPRFDSAFRFRVSILRSDSAFDSASVSAFRFCVPILRFDSAFRFCVSILHLFPRYAFASAFRFRGFREVHSGSGVGSLAGEEEGRFFGTRTFVDEHFRIYGRINRRGRPVFRSFRRVSCSESFLSEFSPGTGTNKEEEGADEVSTL